MSGEKQLADVSPAERLRRQPDQEPACRL